MVAKKASRTPPSPASRRAPAAGDALSYIYLTLQELEDLASLAHDQHLVDLLEAARSRAAITLQQSLSVRRLKRRPGEGGEAAGQ